MATRYSDIITLRESKPAYNIQNEEKGEWNVFIANDQFNEILRRIISAVQNDDADAHKSFWIEGTYGTGKSHAGAVIKHLLCDDVNDIREYIDEEYSSPKHVVLRERLYKLRTKKRLFPVTLYGQSSIAHVDDLSLQLQTAIKTALVNANIDIVVKTDFDNYIAHIEANPAFWDMLISQSPALASITPDRKKLVHDLRDSDPATLTKVKDALREGGYHILLDSSKLTTWFFEVQDALRACSNYDGLLILWDEFTQVMTSDIGPSLLVALQELTEMAMNSANDSYFFFISHPSALNSLKAEEREKTKGRYHYMRYNMEPVSAFKIMSRKFKKVGTDEQVEMLSNNFFVRCSNLLDTYSSTSTSPAETLQDIKNLFPLHPSTANLATYYAREAGSSSRSVFEFLGNNPAIKEFLDDPDKYIERETITADYLWDYVLPEFNSNVTKFGAVTERYNSYELHVKNRGEEYFSVFKSVLLLNALNNIANSPLVTPSEDNIRNLYVGTAIESIIDDILDFFNSHSIIQKTPGGLFSIQFSALPAKDIENAKTKLLSVDFKTTAQVINFGNAAKDEFDKILKQIARPFSYKMYSVESNEHILLSKVETGRREAKDYELFLALMFARNADELNSLKDIAQRASSEERFSSTTFVVFDSIFTDADYERFIEYQANADCARQHGFAEQQQSHTKCASDMLREWVKDIRKNPFVTYYNGEATMYNTRNIVPTVNTIISPRIFYSGPESLDIIKQKSNTFWKKASVKDTVNNVLLAKSKEDVFERCKGQAIFVQYLLQDSVNDDLELKPDVDPNHPLYKVCQFIDKKIKNADKQVQFNFVEKFIDLTRPPFGLYQSYAGMAMVAYALRKYVNKFFDINGKPHDTQNMVTDVVELFKSWEDGKPTNKVSFKFETPEEGQLCKYFIKLFKLGENSVETEISSLKNARWEITHTYLKKYPLWSLKYYDNGTKDTQEEVRALFGKIDTICSEVGSSNPNLLSDVLNGLKKFEFEMKNVLNQPDAFRLGFLAYLKEKMVVEFQDQDFDDAYSYIASHLQSEVGLWSEDEVKDALKDWKISKNSTEPQPIPSTTPEMYPPHAPVAPNPAAAQIYSHKKVMAGDKIDSLQDIEQAKRILRNIASLNYSDVLDKIIEG